jgi:hypothetical protein
MHHFWIPFSIASIEKVKHILFKLLTIFVNPFSSLEDGSGQFWTKGLKENINGLYQQKVSQLLLLPYLNGVV